MQHIVLLLLACSLCMVPLAAQSAGEAAHEENDSLDTGLEQALPSPDTLVNDFVRHASYGWFPEPGSGWSYGLCSSLNFREWDVVHNLRSSGLFPSSTPYNAESPFSGDEDRIKKKFSSDDASDEFPSEGYSADGIYLMQNIPTVSAILKLSVLYDYSRTRLYAVDESRSFLSEFGRPSSYKEVTVLFANHHSLSAGAALMIPVYGAFLQSEAASISSFYYLNIGAQGSYMFLNENTQYTQIATHKDELRFLNGTDTLTFIDKQPLSTAKSFRWYVDLALGWKVGILGGPEFCFELYGLLPQSSVLSDAEWKQYRFGARIAIGLASDPSDTTIHSK